MDLNIQTEADILELDSELSTHQHSFPGFARQMWAYITVNQLLAERWEKQFCYFEAIYMYLYAFNVLLMDQNRKLDQMISILILIYYTYH